MHHCLVNRAPGSVSVYAPREADRGLMLFGTNPQPFYGLLSRFPTKNLNILGSPPQRKSLSFAVSTMFAIICVPEFRSNLGIPFRSRLLPPSSSWMA